MAYKLSTLIESWDGDTSVAASINGDALTRQDFLQLVNATAAQLQDHPSGRWALFSGGAVYFAIGLLALIRTGRIPVILPHAQEGLLAERSATVDGLLAQRQHPAFSGPVVAICDVPGKTVPLNIAPSESAALLTSGTTGQPEEIVKSLRSLEAECETIEAEFGKLVEGREVYGTVSHQHIYGMLFRVLWPLLSGRIVTDRLLKFPEDVHHVLGAQDVGVLVSSPAFLKRSIDVLDQAIFEQAGPIIFSSGGPLPNPVACALNSWSGVNLYEIYGSTETGGIAWRQTLNPAQEDWNAFPAVQLGTDGELLKVRSPHHDLDDWFATQDRVEMAGEGRFRLLGRVDRIAKIEEKRVNLTEMERKLGECAEVAETKVLIDESRHRGVSAVVKLSDAGFARLRALGKQGLRSQLSSYLEQWFEGVTLPRQWRFVKALPENTQGKIAQTALVSLFNDPPLGTILPSPVEVRHDGDTAELTLHISPDLAVLQGHFPDLPIVAGVAQISWAWAFAQEYLQVKGYVIGMEVIKFRKVLLPETDLSLRLDWDRDKSKVHFEFRNDDVAFSSGRLRVQVAQ